ncbi:E2/UBC family protein [Nitrolancea hollandica]|uniref:Uncharacterized protein n=1 Tax=Nitrolancea hollandica Lb TaxID=1129897 RepID=I4EKV1_9BACT|nr:E2/UBC family protein [Nitrolancea hollandica]CCF85313.1 hypothetical protein NITHO_480011 [Nitrolancea hollandica Lb]
MAAPDVLREHARELEELTGVTAEVLEEGGRLYVLLSPVRLPEGVFRVISTRVIFVTDHQYPYSALDMFWTDLDVVRADGGIPRNSDSIETYLGQQWRRFSWHSNSVHNPVRNCLLDHYAFMESRFAEEGRR